MGAAPLAQELCGGHIGQVEIGHDQIRALLRCQSKPLGAAVGFPDPYLVSLFELSANARGSFAAIAYEENAGEFWAGILG
jgi:hypothetical protein